jgi:hypothetical protein
VPGHRIAIATLAAASIFSVSWSDSPVAVGSRAPAFKLSGDAGAPGAASGATLIAFLDFAAPVTDAALSKSQVDVVRAVANAHPEDAFRTVLVDASGTVNGRRAPLTLLESRIKEWGLERMPIVQDHEGAGLARRYGVTIVPSVFLVDGEGIVRGRWDGFVGGGEIEQTIGAIQAAGREPGGTIGGS